MLCFQDLGKYGLLYYNSLLTLPPTLAMVLYSGDLHKVGLALPALPTLHSPPWPWCSTRGTSTRWVSLCLHSSTQGRHFSGISLI